MENLRRRVDPKTGLVRPLTAHMARELVVSRSIVSRELRGLRECGAFETVDVRVSPKQLTTNYRLKARQAEGIGRVLSAIAVAEKVIFNC